MSQTPLKEREYTPVKFEESTPETRPRSPMLALALVTTVVLLVILAGINGIIPIGVLPGAKTGVSTGNSSLPPPHMPVGDGVPAAINMGMPGGARSITSLQAPLTAPQMERFTLVADNATLSLGNRMQVPAWAFNGMAPGPTLHVHQGELVVVQVVNHLSFGITVHWHGVAVPNAADGVAGVTQDAIKPEQTYTYRFFAQDPGTYWYHAHQFAAEETQAGLFGMLIVDPATPTIHADVEYSLALHRWNLANGQPIFTMNNSAGVLNLAAKPGQWVRLRIVETSDTPSTLPHLLTLLGVPFKVVALDGHDLNEPQWLNETPLPLGTGQRYDVLFQMPVHGPVTLVTADENTGQQYQHTPALVIGKGSAPATLPAVKQWFDLTTYGQPADSSITLQSHFDQTYGIVFNNQMGRSLGRMGMTYTMNGKVFPDTGMIMVKEGQLVKIHLDNKSDLYHPIHLHGHIFTVLAHNGQALTGSPIQLDTILLAPHTSYDIAFEANNPGIWMIHCHNFLHANWGMDMMLMYDGYSTPYNVGTQSGNFPD